MSVCACVCVRHACVRAYVCVLYQKFPFNFFYLGFFFVLRSVVAVMFTHIHAHFVHMCICIQMIHACVRVCEHSFCVHVF